jgi:hypothetical protein
MYFVNKINYKNPNNAICLFIIIALSLIPTKKILSQDITTKVFFINKLEIQIIDPLYIKEKNKQVISKKIFDNSLIFEPGIYKINNKEYDFSREGLYRVFDFNGNSRQILIYEKDIHQLISSLSWIIHQGHQDHNLSYSEKFDKLKNYKLSLSCGHAVNFAINFLSQLGINARQISTFAFKDLNGLTDSHVFLEVFRNDIKKWTLYDLANNIYLTSKKGDQYTFLEFYNNFNRKNFLLGKLSNDTFIDTQSFKIKNINFSNFYESLLGSDNQVIDWYEKILQIPFIYTNGKYFTFVNMNKAKINFLGQKFNNNNFDYIYLSMDDFKNKFYINQ